MVMQSRNVPLAREDAVPSVLVVENEPDQLGLYFKLLEGEGLKVHLAGDCTAAWNVARNLKSLDLVIADIGLSDGDGRRIVGELKLKFGCPALVVSGYTPQHASNILDKHAHEDACGMPQAKTVPPDRWLLKPVDATLFREAVRELIARPGLSRA